MLCVTDRRNSNQLMNEGALSSSVVLRNVCKIETMINAAWCPCITCTTTATDSDQMFKAFNRAEYSLFKACPHNHLCENHYVFMASHNTLSLHLLLFHLLWKILFHLFGFNLICSFIIYYLLYRHVIRNKHLKQFMTFLRLQLTGLCLDF